MKKKFGTFVNMLVISTIFLVLVSNISANSISPLSTEPLSEGVGELIILENPIAVDKIKTKGITDSLTIYESRPPDYCGYLMGISRDHEFEGTYVIYLNDEHFAWPEYTFAVEHISMPYSQYRFLKNLVNPPWYVWVDLWVSHNSGPCSTLLYVKAYPWW